MIRRNTWIILAVFIVLLGLLLYLQKNPLPKSDSGVTPTPTMTTSLLPETVTSKMKVVTFKLNDLTFVIRQDEQGNWISDTEKGEAISSDSALQLINQLKEAYILQYLSTEPDTKSTGLTSPQAEIEISDGSNILTSIRIGNPTPTDSGYYIQIGSDAPLVAPKDSISPFLSITPDLGTETSTPDMGVETSTPGVDTETPAP